MYYIIRIQFIKVYKYKNLGKNNANTAVIINQYNMNIKTNLI